jgi:hypothetical protein
LYFDFFSATTSESPSPVTTTQDMPTPTTVGNYPTTTNTQMVEDGFTMFEPVDDTTTDIPAAGSSTETDSALTQLLADVSLDSLEQIVGELFPDQIESDDDALEDEDGDEEERVYVESEDLEQVDYSGESL